MPQDLESIVQKMIDANESEENIASVIKEFNSTNSTPVKPTPKGDTYKGPTTFSEGFKQSLTSGEALKTGLRGAKGFLKGATVDIPSSMFGALESIGNLITSPIETIKSIPSGLSSMWDTTKRAGSEPENFGRMMGQVTGQPLVTAGIVKGAPTALKMSGGPIETTGRLMRQYQPLSGIIPRIAEMRTLRNIERGVGRKLESIGNRIKGASKSKVESTYSPFE